MDGKSEYATESITKAGYTFEAGLGRYQQTTKDECCALLSAFYIAEVSQTFK